MEPSAPAAEVAGAEHRRQPGWQIYRLGKEDGSIVMWMSRIRDRLASPPPNASLGKINGLAFSPNGRNLATASKTITPFSWMPGQASG
jgi:hypothetical protein